MPLECAHAFQICSHEECSSPSPATALSQVARHIFVQRSAAPQGESRPHAHKAFNDITSLCHMANKSNNVFNLTKAPCEACSLPPTGKSQLQLRNLGLKSLVVAAPRLEQPRWPVGHCPLLAACSRSEAARTFCQGATCHLEMAHAHDNLGRLTKRPRPCLTNCEGPRQHGMMMKSPCPSRCPLSACGAADQEDNWHRAGKQGPERDTHQSSVGQSASCDIM